MYTEKWNNNKIDINDIYMVYRHLEDELSKDIFTAELLYYLTNDGYYLYNSARKFYGDILDPIFCLSGDVVIFGAGKFGKRLYQMLNRYAKNIKVCCFIDNRKEKISEVSIPVVPVEEFVRNYNNEIIIVTPMYHNVEMCTQLEKLGIKKAKIINMGGADCFTF